MKGVLFSVILADMLSIVAGAAFAGDSVIKWHTDVHSALQDARATNKPVVLFFTAKWCQYCHKMENDTFTNPAIAHKLNNSFVPLLVDVDEHQDLVDKFKVDGFPAMLFFGPDGKFRERASGYKSVDDTRKLLDEAGR